MKSPDRLPTRASFGSKDIGDRWVTITTGFGEIGSVLPLKGHTGHIRTTTTIGKAGTGTKGIGTTRTTTMAIGGTMIVGGGIVITTIKGMKTNRNSVRLWNCELLFLGNASVSMTCRGTQSSTRVLLLADPCPRGTLD
jgi:hypothetical protein